jgi:hypothetical protein
MVRGLFLAFVLTLAACGGGISQSDACKKYIACYEAAGGAHSSEDATYGPTGTCWATTQASADACSSFCQKTVDALRPHYPDLAECK